MEILEVRKGSTLIVLKSRGAHSRVWDCIQAEGFRRANYVGLSFFRGDPPEWWGVYFLRNAQEVLNAHPDS